VKTGKSNCSFPTLSISHTESSSRADRQTDTHPHSLTHSLTGRRKIATDIVKLRPSRTNGMEIERDRQTDSCRK